MILGIISTICGYVGIYGIFTGNVTLIMLGGIVGIAENLIELFKGTQNSLITAIIAATAGGIWAYTGGSPLWLGVLVGLCLESAIMGLLTLPTYLYIAKTLIPAPTLWKAYAAVATIAVVILGVAVWQQQVYLSEKDSAYLDLDGKYQAQVEQGKKDAGEIKRLTLTNKTLTSQLDVAKSNAYTEDLSEELTAAQQQIEYLQGELSDLVDEARPYVQKAAFLDNRMALRPEKGTIGAYHTLDCPLLGTSQPFYSTVNEAEAAGCWPCPQCH